MPTPLPIERVELAQGDAPYATATLVLLAPPPPVGTACVLRLGEIDWRLDVTDADASQAQAGEEVWTLTLRSPVAALANATALQAAPYGGMASAIAATLLAPHALDWQAIDWWVQPPDASALAGRSPLDAALALAAAGGARLRSLPDGTLVVRHERIGPPLARVVALEASIDTTPHPIAGGIAQHAIASASIDIAADMRSALILPLPWRELTVTVSGAAAPCTAVLRDATERVAFVAGIGRLAHAPAEIVAIAWREGTHRLVTDPGRVEVWLDAPAETLATITYRYRAWRVPLPGTGTADHLVVREIAHE